MIKNVFTKSIRFRRFTTHKLKDGREEWIYYDCQNNNFVTGHNRQWKSLGFVGMVVSGSIYDKFVNQYGDPYDAIFSPKVRISLLILIPVLDRIITFLVRYIRDNKESNFHHLALSKTEAIKIYKKNHLKDAWIDLLIILAFITTIFESPSGGRTICIYFFEDLLVTGVPEYFEEREIYNKVLKSKS
ncbi:hypothetical protein ACWCL1_06545 [Ligilactobacillus sp. LYQ135]